MANVFLSTYKLKFTVNYSMAIHSIPDKLHSLFVSLHKARDLVV